MEKYLNERILIILIPILGGWIICDHIFPLIESGQEIGGFQIALGAIGVVGPVLALGHFFLKSDRNWIFNMIAFGVSSISFMASTMFIVSKPSMSILLLSLSVLIPIFSITKSTTSTEISK